MGQSKYNSNMFLNVSLMFESEAGSLCPCGVLYSDPNKLRDDVSFQSNSQILDQLVKTCCGLIL
jgi:hypothetical protein